MQGLTDSRFLNSANLQEIVEVATSTLERNRPLLYLDRLSLVNANDEELMGRFTGRVIAADIIADGQKAVVYEGGKIELVTTSLPNIKIGQNLNQSTINLLARLDGGNGRTVDADALLDWETRFGENLVQGVRERMNEMACAMMLDSYSYNRFGIILTGATWGMPANLKVTVSPLWSLDAGVTSNVANAKPIRDILAMDNVDADNYGLGPFDRVTMSTTAFSMMTQTTDFLNRASLYVNVGFALSAGMLSVENRSKMVELAGEILSKEIVLDDKTMRLQATTGAQTTSRVLPSNKVLLDRKGNGANEWDFGNGIVTESIVAKMLGMPTLGENPRMALGGAYGPLGYYTPQTFDLNAPGINGWAVARGFPRKFIPEASAVLTVF